MIPAAYREVMRPYAERAAAALGGRGLTADLIMAHWDWEVGVTAFGVLSNLAMSHNNHGGIKYVPATVPCAKRGIRSPEGDHYASYPSLDCFTDDYVRVMRLGSYAPVRDAATEADAAAALGASPYSGGSYGTPPGSGLLALLRKVEAIEVTVPGARVRLGAGGVIVMPADGAAVAGAGGAVGLLAVALAGLLVIRAFRE